MILVVGVTGNVRAEVSPTSPSGAAGAGVGSDTPTPMRSAGAQLRTGDVVRVPFANVRTASVDPFDIAAVALTQDGHDSKVYYPTGPESMHPMGPQRHREPVADIPARLPHHQMCAHTEHGVVIDPGQRLDPLATSSRNPPTTSI